MSVIFKNKFINKSINGLMEIMPILNLTIQQPTTTTNKLQKYNNNNINNNNQQQQQHHQRTFADVQ